jgi:hypothetical protein
MNSTEDADDFDGVDLNDVARMEGVELSADPARLVNLDTELLELLHALGAARLLLEDRRLPGETFLARPLLPVAGLAEMAVPEPGPEGFVSAADAWHRRLRGAPLPPRLRARLAEVAAALAEAETGAREVPDHIYTLY